MSDRDLFFAIGDRHLVKRSQNDRDREIQWSRSQKRDLDPFSFFLSNQPYASQIFQKCQSLNNENFEKKRFWFELKLLPMIMKKLAYETYDKYLINSK